MTVATKVIRNHFIALLGFFLAGPVIADPNDFRCLKSVGLKKTLRLQFTFPADSGDVGSVTYENGSGPISVKRLKEKELRRVPGGRPSEFEIDWTEITPDGNGGRYVFISQGAIIDNFRYIRKDGKVFRFEEDVEASGDNGCTWAKK